MKFATLIQVGVLFCIASYRTDADQVSSSEIFIDLWYGDEQSFGHLGDPQRQINILGNASGSAEIVDLRYSLNGAVPFSLSLGPDLHRLAGRGDFNVELDVSELLEGSNRLVIIAIDSDARQEKRTVIVNYARGRSWPLPYEVRWSQVKEIQPVGQVIDGHWVLEQNGVRTLEPYYDRIVAFGDSGWSNYEVSTSVVFHSFTPPREGPPTYNVSHAAIATRWPGHDRDQYQPNRKWYPLGATAEFRLTSGLDKCRWRIFDGENLYLEDLENPRAILLGAPYMMKHRVETLADEKTLYRVKLWEAEKEEPNDWDFGAVEPAGNLASGSALLIAHHTDVTFGDIYVRPVE